MSLPMLSVSLIVEDMEKSIAFYTQTLGFENTFQMPDPDGNLMHADLTLKNAHIMLGPSMWLPEELIPYRGAGVNLYITVEEDDDIDQYYAMVKGKGVNIVEDITDQFWGDRSFSIKDPDGYKLTFGKTVRQVSTEEMMEAMKQMA
jgi:PhnB protein